MSRLPKLTLSALVLGLAGTASGQGFGETVADVIERTTGKKLAPEDRQRIIEQAKLEIAQQESLRQTSADELDAELKALRAALTMEPEGGVKLSSGPGRGFTLLSADENFSLNLGAMIQIQASYTDLDSNRVGHGAPPIPPFPTGTTYGGNQDTSNWAVRRARLLMQGHAFDPKFTYRLQFEGSSGLPVDTTTGTSNDVGLLDALVNYEFDPAFNLAAGQLKVPFGLQQVHQAWRLQTVERSNSSNFFAPPPRDIGGVVWGLIGEPDAPVIEYSVGVFNGEGIGGKNSATFQNDEPGQMVVAALRFEPFGEEDRAKLLPTWLQSEGDPLHLEDPYLQIGGGATYDEDDNNATGRGAERTRANAEAQFKMAGFSAQGEYFWEWFNPSGGTTRLNKGFYVQAGYFILPSEFEIYGRYDHVDLSRTALSSQYYGPITTYEVDEVTVGLGYFFSPDNPHAWKIQAEAVYRSSEAIGATLDFDDKIFRAMLTFVL